MSYNQANYTAAGVIYAAAAQALQTAIINTQVATMAWQQAQGVSALCLIAMQAAAVATPFVPVSFAATLKAYGIAVRLEQVALNAVNAATAAQAPLQAPADQALQNVIGVAHGLATDPT